MQKLEFLFHRWCVNQKELNRIYLSLQTVAAVLRCSCRIFVLRQVLTICSKLTSLSARETFFKPRLTGTNWPPTVELELFNDSAAMQRLFRNSFFIICSCSQSRRVSFRLFYIFLKVSVDKRAKLCLVFIFTSLRRVATIITKDYICFFSN